MGSFKDDWFGKRGKSLGAKFDVPEAIQKKIDAKAKEMGLDGETAAMMGKREISDDHKVLTITLTTEDENGLPPSVAIRALEAMVSNYKREWMAYCKEHGVDPDMEGGMAELMIMGCGEPGCEECKRKGVTPDA